MGSGMERLAAATLLTLVSLALAACGAPVPTVIPPRNYRLLDTTTPRPVVESATSPSGEPTATATPESTPTATEAAPRATPTATEAPPTATAKATEAVVESTPTIEATGTATATPTEPSPLSAPDSAATAVADLADELRPAIEPVVVGEQVEPFFFDALAHQMTIAREYTQVITFPSAKEAAAAAATIAPDALTFDNRPARWLGTPHVFLSGRHILIYVGDTAAIIDALTGALGEQIAGG